MKPNLGCGRDTKEGWVNLDRRKGEGVDVVHNLDELPLPFDDDTFDEVYASHVLEHVLRWENLLCDIHRIMKPEGVLTVRVPYGLDPTAYHIRTFMEWTLDSFLTHISQGRSLENEEKLFRQRSKRIRRQLFGKYLYHVNKYLHLGMPECNPDWLLIGRKKEIHWVLEAIK